MDLRDLREKEMRIMPFPPGKRTGTRVISCGSPAEIHIISTRRTAHGNCNWPPTPAVRLKTIKCFIRLNPPGTRINAVDPDSITLPSAGDTCQSDKITKQKKKDRDFTTTRFPLVSRNIFLHAYSARIIIPRSLLARAPTSR